MNRPPSIITFERLYLGSIVASIIGIAFNWSTMQSTLASNPALAGNPKMASMASTISIGSFVVTIAVSLLLWYLVARRGSVVAKWFVVVTEAIGALFAVFALIGLLTGRSPNAVAGIIGLIATALAVAAAVMLFKPDAKTFLGEGSDAPTDVYE